MGSTFPSVAQQLNIGLGHSDVFVSEQFLDSFDGNPRLVEQRLGCRSKRVGRVAASLLAGAVRQLLFNHRARHAFEEAEQQPIHRSLAHVAFTKLRAARIRACAKEGALREARPFQVVAERFCADEVDADASLRP